MGDQTNKIKRVGSAFLTANPTTLRHPDPVGKMKDIIHSFRRFPQRLLVQGASFSEINGQLREVLRLTALPLPHPHPGAKHRFTVVIPPSATSIPVLKIPSLPPGHLPCCN